MTEPFTVDSGQGTLSVDQPAGHTVRVIVRNHATGQVTGILLTLDQAHDIARHLVVDGQCASSYACGDNCYDAGYDAGRDAGYWNGLEQGREAQ